MLEHEVRHGCPGITAFLFQEAEDPQPRAVPSAFVLEILLWYRSGIGITDAPRYPPHKERGRPQQDASAGAVFSPYSLVFSGFLIQFLHSVLLS
jgi:hypothetical protein